MAHGSVWAYFRGTLTPKSFTPSRLLGHEPTRLSSPGAANPSSPTTRPPAAERRRRRRPANTPRRRAWTPRAQPADSLRRRALTSRALPASSGAPTRAQPRSTQPRTARYRLPGFLRCGFASLASAGSHHRASDPAAATAAAMAPADFFFDLSLLPDDSSSSNTSTSTRLLAAAAARALDLGYSAVALDHPHRGLLNDSHSAPGIASSLPRPPSSSLHQHRRSHPFQQFTRVTLSLDSAAACASALAPSAARLLRTYDIVAARPLTQAAFDHLCQAAFDHLDIVSIDFSHKLPFRLKLPMLKLALQRGLYFEIAYSPLITDPTSRRQLITQAKLLVDWTKGKNLIISSAAHTAAEIRGPYDVANLCAYLLGLSTHRAKAAISINCRFTLFSH
ncbi:hypothetical protein GUJ93_ZPchr0011g27685 [Zizania palustris]|uniref:Uncharacterized protein n=1 Tax=Zizania palustris TaxID=103762 RepID=A0A8J5WFV8_ZIZPA|nr:hypothetical protein GUJ93_ZPchr0011g27685 [Zizania palustris]